MHLQQFSLGFSVCCCGSKQKTGTKEESSKNQNHICDFELEENQDRNQIYGQAAIQCLKLQKREEGSLKALQLRASFCNNPNHLSGLYSQSFKPC